jgi:3-deoxy-D-manno-octulosonate 8-phosphate phosphatase (KDO 8-P phosphatase)
LGGDQPLAQKRKIPGDIKRRLADLKAIFLEVDGVLTNGKLIYDLNGTEYKQFHFRDAAAVPPLQQAGIVVGVVSARESGIVTKWCADLRMEFCHQGILDKASTVTKLAAHYRLKLKEIAFIGSDFSDVPVFEMVGLAVTTSDAPENVRRECDLVTRAKGGSGAFRELADLVLQKRNS